MPDREIEPGWVTCSSSHAASNVVSGNKAWNLKSRTAMHCLQNRGSALELALAPQTAQKSPTSQRRISGASADCIPMSKTCVRSRSAAALKHWIGECELCSVSTSANLIGKLSRGEVSPCTTSNNDRTLPKRRPTSNKMLSLKIKS